MNHRLHRFSSLLPIRNHLGISLAVKGAFIASQAPLAVLTSLSTRLRSNKTTFTISRNYTKKIVVDLFGWFREMVKVVLFERNRVDKLVNTAKGAWDAMKAPLTAREIPR